MTQNPSASDWATTRGDQWQAQFTSMEAMLQPVDTPLIQALDLREASRIADLGCGGGGTSLEIQRQAPASSTVHGFDISPSLIATALGRADQNDGLDDPTESTIAFQVADLATAPPPADPYDRLLSRFGLLFFDDPPAAFTNLRQWLRPGGRFAFAAWGPPAENLWMTCLREAMAEVMPLPPPDPEAPGPFRYGDANKLLNILSEVEFADLDVIDWRGVLALGGGLTAPVAVSFALESFALANLLSDAGEAAREEVQRSLTARFARHLEAGVVRMPARVHILTGMRPEAG